jgi:hypothetical protein
MCQGVNSKEEYEMLVICAPRTTCTWFAIIKSIFGHYRIKALLIIYLKSDVFKAILGDDGEEKQLDFICGCCINPHKQSFCSTWTRVWGIFTRPLQTHVMKIQITLYVCLHSMCQSAKIILDMNCNRFDLYRWQFAPALLGRSTWSSLMYSLPAKFILY